MNYEVGQILINRDTPTMIYRVSGVGDKISVEIPSYELWAAFGSFSRSSLEGFDVYAPVKATPETSAHQSNS
jgi:hypothetical protein